MAWAWMAKLVMPDVRLVTAPEHCGNGAHAFARYGKYYYDSSRPQGVLRFSSLTFFKASADPPICVVEMPPSRFKRWWENGTSDGFSAVGLPWFPETLPRKNH